MNKPLIGVFGSAFDPPTLGHFDVLQQAAQVYSTILLVPSASHAFNKQSQPFHTRIAMLECFVTDLSLPDCSLEICDIEQNMLMNHPEKPVYTYDLLVELEKKYINAELGFIRGPDNAHPDIWSRFYKATEIEKNWSIFTAEERLTIRSSTVREILGTTNLSMQKKALLETMLRPSVLEYIQHNNVYSL